jgi:uncharacterized Zn-finger protein
MFSQRNVDLIVNVALYHYGLVFSNDWAQPYWFYARMLYVTQFVSIALSLVALGSGFLKKEGGDKPASKLKGTVKKTVAAREETNGRDIVISCSSCKRVFSKPLVMLDFSSGKAKLVNVCPYCNTVVDKAQEQSDVETVVNPEKKVVR